MAYERGTPMRWLMGRHAYEMHAYERHVYEMVPVRGTSMR